MKVEACGLLTDNSNYGGKKNNCVRFCILAMPTVMLFAGPSCHEMC